MKDATRQRAYRAEQSVRRLLSEGSKDGNAPGDITFKGADAARALLPDIAKACKPIDHDPTHKVDKVEVSAKTKGGSSWYKRFDGPAIQLHEGWGECGLVLVHEYSHHLAHNITPLYTSDAIPSHGGEWTRLFLDAVDLFYGSVDRRDVGVHLRAAFEKQRAIVSTHAQCEAARKQVLRLRSDVRLAYGKNMTPPGIPVTDVVFATTSSDFTGASYDRTYGGLIDIASVERDHLVVETPSHDGGCVAIPWCNLRYVSGPMVRHR